MSLRNIGSANAIEDKVMAGTELLQAGCRSVLKSLHGYIGSRAAMRT
jgi:hypothetical protein